MTISKDELFPRLDRIETKQDEIQSDIKEMLVVITKNTADVEYHIKRSDAAEETVKILNDRLEVVEDIHKKHKWTVGLIVAISGILTFLKAMNII